MHPYGLLVAVSGLSSLVAWFGQAVDVDPPRPRDLPRDVRAVFAARCAGCHGADLAKPKGRFGYVLDLSRLANDREKVVPGSPQESELWELVKRNEMPPADAPAGPLTDREKQVIQAWIAAGAPTGTLASSSDSTLAENMEGASSDARSVEPWFLGQSRWRAIAACGLVSIASFLAERDIRRGAPRFLTRLLFLVSVLLIASVAMKG
jgi:mono/diheme cytochrome c family protein